MRSTRTAMEYIINFLISTWKKYKVVPRRVYAVVTNLFPKGDFYTDKTNEHDISAYQIDLFLVYNYVLVIVE